MKFQVIGLTPPAFKPMGLFEFYDIPKEGDGLSTLSAIPSGALSVQAGALGGLNQYDDGDGGSCHCIVALHILREWHRWQNCRHHYSSIVVQ